MRTQPQRLSRRGLIGSAAALATVPSLSFADNAAPAPAAPLLTTPATPNSQPWTRDAFQTAMAASGRPVSITDAQFNAIQARKPAAMKAIADYLKMRLGAADPLVLAAFQALPREYYHYIYPERRSTCGDAYDQPPKPWALGYGSALSDYLGQ
ncbi:MAG: protein-L-isoaspartate O-methyltransferase, partial [Acidocella sp.]|nr:protein-L-isoaspartate O-methyltransferase [Acidocella sp.]